MRTTKTITVEKGVTTYKCDFCDYSTENNRGCCGTAPIMTCEFCEKDICRKHRDFFTEDHWSDYPYGFWACPDCQPKAEEAWDWAQEHAGRHDDIVDVTTARFREITVAKPI